MLEQWHSTMAAAGFSPNTIALYLRTVKELDVEPEAVTATAIEKFIQQQIKINSRSTANTKLQALRSFVTWAEGRGLLSGVLRLLPSKVKAPAPNVYVPSRKDITDVGAVLRPKHRLALWLMADAGLRRHEVISVRPQDVDLDRGIIRVVGKGSKAREVPVATDRLRAEMEKALKASSEWLVPGRGGRRMSVENLGKVLEAACKRAEVERFTPHALRHSFAAHSARRLVDMKAIQRVLGHNNLGTTDRYLKSLESQAEIVEAYSGFDE